MNKKKDPKKTKSALRRRQFIHEQANLHGYVSFSEIEDKGFSTGWQSLKGDADFFEDMKLGIELRKGKFIMRGYDLKSTLDEREEKQVEESKMAIARLAGALLWGTKSSLGQDACYPEPCIEMIRDQLEEQCHSDKTPNRARDAIAGVRDQLNQYWEKKHRSCALDGGTTTAAVAGYLASKKAPDSNAGIVSLTTLTNSPLVEKILEGTSASTGVVAIGGQLRKDTFARTGSLCEQCLNAWQIRLDIAIVGTTSLNSHGSQGLCLTCDSPDEARIKGLLLEKADIRCVVMSSQKCGRRRTSPFIFTSASQEFVDLIITDKGIYKWFITDDEIHNRAITGSESGRSEKLCDRLLKAGVGVLVT